MKRHAHPTPRLTVRLRCKISTIPFSDSDVGAPSTDCGVVWLPYTLRWRFLFALALISIALCLIVSALCWLSSAKHGLGTDDGSNVILLGWRFSPTLICVMYAHLVGMAFSDVKKTEPYARMARPSGASAEASVLQVPKPWWSALMEAFSKRKNARRINIPLLCSSLAFITSVLVISPLSLSFLVSFNFALAHDAQFHRIIMDPTPFPLTATPETFLRTTGQLFYNVTGTPWISGQYTVLPFWPLGMPNDPFLDSNFFPSPGSWTAPSRVVKVEYPCKRMDVRTTFENKSFMAPGNIYHGNTIPPYSDSFTILVNGTSKMATISLSLADDCQYQIDASPTLDINRQKSVVWSRGSAPLYDKGMGYPQDQLPSNDTDSWLYIPGNSSYVLEFGSGPTSPYLRFKESPQCQDKQILLLATPMLTNDELLLSNYSPRAWACSSNISVADIPVTLSMSGTVSNISFSEKEFLRNRIPMGEDMLNTSQVHALFNNPQWASYSAMSSFWSHQSAIPLTESYDDDFSALTDDQNLLSRAESIFVRFFAELLQSSILQENSPQLNDVQGHIGSFEKRIVVVPNIGITLSVLFALNAFLLLLLSRKTRPCSRPLNLETNASSVLSVARLMTAGKLDMDLWQTMPLAKREVMSSSLVNRIYRTSFAQLLETCDGDVECKVALQGTRIHGLMSCST